MCRYAAVNAVCCTYDSLILTVEEVAESSTYTQSVEARGLDHQLKSFSFIVALVTFDRILTCTKQLSDQLQSSSIDLSRASELVLATKSLLTDYCTVDYWQKVYDYATEVANLHCVTIQVTSRKRKRPSHLAESIVHETVGSVLDKFLYELNARFQDSNLVIMKGVSACTPTSSNFLLCTDLDSFAEMYAVDTRTLEVEVNLVKTVLESQSTVNTLAIFRSYLHSCQPAYNTLYLLTKIALTIAVTSAESERSFSALKRIKTRLRTRMAEDRLSDL